MSYLTKRFEAAVSVLVADGPIKQRLTTAYSEHLDDLESSEFPIKLRPVIIKLHAALHSVKPIGREPCVKATIRKMSSKEAGNHARTIFSLFSTLFHQDQRSAPLRVVGAPKKLPKKSSLSAN